MGAKNNSMRFRMFLSVFLGSTMMTITGCNLVWTSPLLKKLKNTEDNPLGIPITDDQGSWITALSILGGVVGCILFGALSQKISRKILLVIVCIPFLVFYLTMVFGKVLWLFFVARFICGLAMGGTMTLLAPYICEIADPKIRGKLCVTISVCTNLGTLLTYCTGPYISFYWYHLSLSLLPITFSILFFIFGVESPYHIFRSNPDKAEQILRELRGQDDVSEEIGEIRRGINKPSEENFISVLKSRSNRRSLMIGAGLSFFTQCTGYLALMSFAVFVFDEAGGSWSGEVDTIILAITELTASFFATTITDLFQRKTQFIVSYVSAGLCHFVLGGYFVLQDQGFDLANFGWVPVLSMAGYFIMYDLGMGILTQTLLGELFSPAFKSSGVAICQMVGNVIGFLLTLSFDKIQEIIGEGESFWLFAAFSFGGAIFVKVCLVETKGKTLEQVQNDIDGSN